MVIYSHSRLSTFEQCKLKYKYRYIDKIIPEVEKTIEAHLGTCVHDTLEWLYKLVKGNKIPTVDETIMHYSEKWSESFSENIVIVRKHFDAKHYFNQGIKFLLDYYLTHQPFEDNTIEVEKRVVVNLGNAGEHKIQGFIDRLVHNQEENEYEIHDYKTANSMPSLEKLENDRQLALYSIAIKEIYNAEKVCLNWHFLNFNKKVCLRKTEEQLEQLKQDIINLIGKIETAKEFPPEKSALCDWCEYKSMCPAWNPELEKKKFNDEIEKYPTLKKYFRD